MFVDWLVWFVSTWPNLLPNQPCLHRQDDIEDVEKGLDDDLEEPFFGGDVRDAAWGG